MHRGFTDLPSAPPHPFVFTPNGPNEWNGYTLSIPYEQFFTENFRLMFEFESRLGNNIFLDDINIEMLTPADVLEREAMVGLALQIYPNPADAGATLEFTMSQPHGSVAVSALDLTGRIVWTGFEGGLPKGVHRFDVPTADWASGTYLIWVEADGRRMAKQLMVR